MDADDSNSPSSPNSSMSISSPSDSKPPSSYSYEVLTFHDNVQVRVYPHDLYSVLGMVKERVLGKGASGEVILARNPKDPSKTMAIKRFLDGDGDEEATLHRYLKEVSIILKLNHPNVVGNVLPITCPENMVICMEYYPHGDLDFQLGYLTHEQIQIFFIQLACAVRHMHKRNIIHRDIKLDNLFIKDDRNIILGDFGLARQLPPDQNLVEGHVGTYNFMAPEVRRYSFRNFPKKYDGFKADAYSCGVVLWSLLLDVYPEDETYFIEALFLFKDRLDPFLCMCASYLLTDNTDDRKSLAGVLEFLRNHNYYSGLIDSL